jgi:F-type H+-transporting ATPase subunit alpha
MSLDIKVNMEQISEEYPHESFSTLISDYIKNIKLKNTSEQQNFPKTEAIIQSLLNKSKEINGVVHFEEVGTVQHIGNGVANISGLSQAAIDELVVFRNGTRGLILNLHTMSLDVILLGNEEGIQGGSLVTHQINKLKIPVGIDLIGRVINALGEPIDDGPDINSLDFRFIERPAPDITHRSPVNTPLQTGIKIIDALFPIGKGQRELIVGDRQTGKTTLVVDTIINQRGKNVKCVYVSIGQKKSSLSRVNEVLRKKNAFDYTIVISAAPDDPPAQKYLAPFTGMTVAEFFLDQGDDVLIIFDDLTKHADAYRELSLLLRRPPGREAYPGDIFYLHSRLLERACKLSVDQGGGSITAIPIIAMQQGNISAYIPTNLISICDGQIVLDKEKFNKGFKPAVNIGISVSRVGGAAQTEAMRGLANTLKLELSQFEEVEKFTQFGTELDETTTQMIKRGQRLQKILTQAIHRPYSLSEQVLLLFATTHGYLDTLKINELKKYEKNLLNWSRNNKTDVLETIKVDKVLSSELEKQIKDLLNSFSLYLEKGDDANE